MKSHLRIFSNTKNKFLMHFDTHLTLIFSFEKWAFWGFFAFFGPKIKNTPLREVFRELYIVEFWVLKHDYGMKSHLRLFRNTKNKFIMHFDAFFILIFSLEKWAFLGFLDFFRQNRQISKSCIFQALEKGAIFHFKRLKIFFRKILAF